VCASKDGIPSLNEATLEQKSLTVFLSLCQRERQKHRAANAKQISLTAPS
jgi:hypothetical protein